MAENDRRKFLKFAGVTTAFTALSGVFRSAQAATWTKIPSATGAANTWHKFGSAGASRIGISSLSIGMSKAQTLALRSDGLAFACGYNRFGQLGDNSSLEKYTFIQSTGISNVIALASGNYESFALRSNGLVYACANNANGELGDNTTVSKSTFVQSIGISNAIAIAGGIAVRSDDLVFACGSNLRGQLGDNTALDRSTFIQSTGISNAIAIAIGYRHSVALRSDGLVFTSGWNSNGQLGTNDVPTNKSTFIQSTGI